MEERGWLTEGRTRRGTGDKATRVRETPYCIARSPSPIFQWLLLTFPSLSSAPSKTSISSSGPYFSISSPSPSQNPIQRPCRRLYSRSSIGFGSSSIVYYATYLLKTSSHAPIPCALKVLDLDRLPQGSLRLLQRETQLMSLSKHPNVLRVRGSWLDGHKLHIALRLMNAGSAADVMHYAWPGGMEEEVVRCVLRQALEGLKQVSLSLSFPSRTFSQPPCR
jgi:hypothetical protein